MAVFYITLFVGVSFAPNHNHLFIWPIPPTKVQSPFSGGISRPDSSFEHGTACETAKWWPFDEWKLVPKCLHSTLNPGSKHSTSFVGASLYPGFVMSVLAAWRPCLYQSCFPLSSTALSARLGVFGSDCEHDHSGFACDKTKHKHRPRNHAESAQRPKDARDYV